MNHRPQVLNFPRVINGFLQYKLAEGLSPATVFNFERDLKLWLVHIGDQEIGKITPANLLEFLNYLRSEYVPRRIAGKEERKLSDKTIYNFYVSLSAFFTWASTEFEMANPMKKVPRPRVAEDAPVEPFRREEIELLIKACDACAEADTHDRRRFTMRRPTGKRDKAILLTLLDTGLWARELCAFDDYSCMLLYADLVERETAWAHIQAAQQLMGGCGLPMRYYVDNLGVFRFV
jgi:integrase/recombinase XerD